MAFVGSDILPWTATCSVYTVSVAKDASGGTAETYPTLAASGVKILISQAGGTRDGRFEGRANVNSGTATGEHASLGSQKMRLVIDNAAPATTCVPHLAGKTLYAETISSHFGIPAEGIPPRYTLRWQQWEGG